MEEQLKRHGEETSDCVDNVEIKTETICNENTDNCEKDGVATPNMFMAISLNNKSDKCENILTQPDEQSIDKCDKIPNDNFVNTNDIDCVLSSETASEIFLNDSPHPEPSVLEVVPEVSDISCESRFVTDEKLMESSIAFSSGDKIDNSSTTSDENCTRNLSNSSEDTVTLKEQSIPKLLPSSVQHVNVHKISVTDTANNIYFFNESHVKKQFFRTNKDDIDEDELLSELESELQLDSDTNSQATDVPASDDDLSSRLSNANSDMSLNLSNVMNSLVKCDSEIDINNEEKHLSISRRSSGSNSSNSNQDCYGRGSEYNLIQIEALERTIVHLRQNVNHYKQRLRSEVEASKNNLEKNKIEYCAKIDKLNKMYDSAKKEKESMVMKFANSEKEKLKTVKYKEDMEKKVREAGKDREMLLGKMKQLTIERSHMNFNLETKITESRNLIRENERLKEEASSKDVKIKWAQNKLKSEVDAHQESQNKLEKVHQKLLETREESEQVRRDCQDMIRRYQDSEEIKSVSLDKELKARTTELEKQKQQKCEQEEVWMNAKEELDSFKQKHKELTEENNSLTVKIQNLEKDRLDHVQTVSKFKDQINNQKQEIVDLKAKLAEMDSLFIQLQREKEKVANSQKEVERLRQTNAELQSDMDACHVKEGELLEFTQRITSKNVQLQNDLGCLEGKLSYLETEVNRLSKLNLDVEEHLTCVQQELVSEKALRKQETQILARKLAEKTKAWEQVTIQLGDSNNENRVLKRRHLASVKELTRELHQTKKRLELFELNNHQQNGTINDRMSITSRTSSSCSLDKVTHNQHFNNTINHQTPSVTFIGMRDNSKASSKITSKTSKKKKGSESSSQESPPETILQPDRQMLIEKIVKLQRIQARKREKIEFLEEHISQLLIEIKRKSKIIQNYIMREEAGALISNSMDENKAELSRKGGIMASVYHAHSLDGAMTLDLSLEINGKLQAVLEDILLKNITLKENINTLGEEISRLTCNNKSPV